MTSMRATLTCRPRRWGVWATASTACMIAAVARAAPPPPAPEDAQRALASLVDGRGFPAGLLAEDVTLNKAGARDGGKPEVEALVHTMGAEHDRRVLLTSVAQGETLATGPKLLIVDVYDAAKPIAPGVIVDPRWRTRVVTMLFGTDRLVHRVLVAEVAAPPVSH